MRIKILLSISIATFFLTSNCTTVNKFSWTSTELALAENIGLSKEEVLVLASIVEKETDLPDERPRIARVYLNRLEKGMLLQSDPTVRFAWKKSKIKQLTQKHYELDSPYNTYKNKGLPPGQICKPSQKSIMAVLNADTNNYLYFCPNSDLSGRFSYAETIVQHITNAKKYRDALNKVNKRK